MDKAIYFRALNNELAKKDLTLDIICVGGFVLEYYGLRGTKDVDAFYQDNYVIEQMIAKVGAVYNINTFDELWLNNAVSNMNVAPSISECEVLYSFSHLNVYAPSLEYILAIKAQSGREQDIIDMGDIIKNLALASPFHVEQMISAMGINCDFSDILEAFGLAYGMDWLEDFFLEHRGEFDKYF